MPSSCTHINVYNNIILCITEQIYNNNNQTWKCTFYLFNSVFAWLIFMLTSTKCITYSK